MTGNQKPDQFKSLEGRLQKAREAANKTAGRDAPEKGVRSGLGFAMRIGVELVSALIVGVLIGYFLDLWLGTKPWLMLLFFLLGSAAGIINVYRTVNGIGQTIGYQKGTNEDKGGDSR